MLKKIVFNKDTSKVYCYSEQGCYAEFPICFNFWGGVNAHGQQRAPIPNGKYTIGRYDIDFGYNMQPAYGRFWVSLDKKRGRGFHGFGAGRTLTSGTYGCVRGNNADGEQICRAIRKVTSRGGYVVAEVVGTVDERKFCIGQDGRQ